MIQRDENSLGTDLEHELDHPGHFWEVTCGTRIFLTGGTGFFGKSLLSYFSENNSGIKKIIVEVQILYFTGKLQDMTLRQNNGAIYNFNLFCLVQIRI